jgi:hypothetical protein
VEGANEIVLGVVNVLELVDEDPAEGGRPSATRGGGKPVEGFQWELIDVVDVCEGCRVLITEDLLAERVEGPTENPAGTNEILESVAHYRGRIVGEGQKDDLIGAGAWTGGIREKPGDAGRERCRFAGTGGGQNAEVLGRRLANDRGLLVIEGDGSFWEGEGR